MDFEILCWNVQFSSFIHYAAPFLVQMENASFIWFFSSLHDNDNRRDSNMTQPYDFAEVWEMKLLEKVNTWHMVYNDTTHVTQPHSTAIVLLLLVLVAMHYGIYTRHTYVTS